MKFEIWLDTFFKEKNIDLGDVFEFEDSEGRFNQMEYNIVVEAIKMASEEKQKQKQIKEKLVLIDFKNGNALDFLKHLGKGLAEQRIQNS